MALRAKQIRILSGLRILLLCAVALVVGRVIAQTMPPSPAQAVAPEIVAVRSGNLRLKAYFWKPSGRGPFPAVLFNHGSGTDAQHTAGQTMADAAASLAPIFLKHRYAFFYVCRRGQGLSADQAPFLLDLLQREESSKGKEARQHLHYVLVTTDQLDDALAGLAVLKAAPAIDPKRIAVVGHSFGGVITLLSGERDNAIRAEVTFGAGANSWKLATELRPRVLSAVGKTSAPIMLVHAANDYDTSPGTDIASELDRLHKAHLLKIYPAIGKSTDDGHNLLYLAVPEWEPDVFQFLDNNVKR